MQCKERVDLLEALRKSRLDPNQSSVSNDVSAHGRDRSHSHSRNRSKSNISPPEVSSGLAGGTIPPFNYPDLVRPTLPPRRSASGLSTLASTDKNRSGNMPDPYKRLEPVPNAPSLDVPTTKPSRTPSPDKKGGLFKSTLRPNPREGARHSTSKLQMTMRNRPPVAAGKAATLAWPAGTPPTASGDTSTYFSPVDPSGPPSTTPVSGSSHAPLNNTVASKAVAKAKPPPPPPPPPPPHRDETRWPRKKIDQSKADKQTKSHSNGTEIASATSARQVEGDSKAEAKASGLSPSQPRGMSGFPSYRREYGASGNTVDSRTAQEIAALAHSNRAEPSPPEPNLSRRPKSPQRNKPPVITRKAVPSTSPPKPELQKNESSSDSVLSSTSPIATPIYDTTSASSSDANSEWDAKAKHLLHHLPKGVDETAAKSIVNEIVIKGDAVNWDDVAGLDIAKSALKEAVVYPFLRPDLFMGLREPARGMLLFGPPGTGKTMLARAVATESRSTFFSISASSLTSKFLGESEKLVRALFAIARRLAPSIIFVDEIDSLLSARGGGGEHEATRRIKTEFLIQWSDLQKAAAGKTDDAKDGDASRVLVLAATNTPWAIDEAARRRFVRRQYIPLPEARVRREQLARLMGAQKNSLSDADFEVLVLLTDGRTRSPARGFWMTANVA